MSGVPTTLAKLQRTAPPIPAKYRNYKIIRPFDKQIEAHEIVQQNTITLYGGAIRGGKSYFMLLELFSLAQEYANSRWLIMRADMPRFEQTTLRSFEELLDSGLGMYMRRWHKGTNTVTWANGSQFVFMAESYSSDKDLMRLHGFECNGAGLDEANELQEITFGKVIERTGSWFHAQPNVYGHTCKPKIIMTCNPNNSWVKKRFYDPWEKALLGKGPGLPKGQAYIPSRIYDNPHVPPEYIESLRMNMDPEKFERYVNGDWNYTEKTGKEWCYNFDYSKHTGEVAFVRNYPSKVSFDFNQIPYQTMLATQFVEINNIIWIRVYDEFCLETPFNTPEHCCEAWEATYMEPFGYAPVDIYGDASEKSGSNGFRGIFDKLSRYMHGTSDQVFKRNPYLEDARTLMNDIFAEKYNIRILIDKENCPNLIRDCDTLQEAVRGFDPVKIKNAAGQYYESKGHCYSALVYVVCMVFFHLLRSEK